jgi:hypothetical protein
MGVIQQNWDFIFYGNSLAIALSLPGLLGPVGATLISNGSAVVATLNALKPLFGGSASNERREQLLQGELDRGADEGIG